MFLKAPLHFVKTALQILKEDSKFFGISNEALKKSVDVLKITITFICVVIYYENIST